MQDTLTIRPVPLSERAQVALTPGKQGPWTIERFTVSEKDAERTKLSAALRGRGYVPPGAYTMLKHDKHGVVMSDTPDEVYDHRLAIASARGHVLVTGLGIGMVVHAMLTKPSNEKVTKITVIEKDADVIALVAHQITDPRVEVIHADAFTYTPPRGTRYGAVWHDIWPNICADNLPEMTKLKRRYGRRADWQGCWAEYECRRQNGWGGY